MRSWCQDLFWALLAALTRWPFSGLSPGESDGARYLIGVQRWLAFGPSASGIYAKVLSPGWYAFAAWAVRRFAVSPARLLDGVSLAAAILTAPLLYRLARRALPAAPAAVATALFLLAPAFWWLGLEPHPQGTSFLFFLIALGFTWNDRRRSSAALAVSTAIAALALGIGLLLKNDLVLLFPGWLALCWPRPSARSSAVAAMAGGSLLFLLARQRILGLGFAAAQRSTDHAVALFLTLPHGVQWLKQALPVATASGLATALFVACGVLLGLRWREWRRRWLVPLIAWSAPGAVFWFWLRGNNVRHMAPYLLVPLWAALAAFMELRPRVPLLAACLAAILLADAALPPASSNVTLYPSGNVPRSARMLAAKNARMDAWLNAQSAAACLAGNYTLPYLALAAGSTARMVEVNSPAEFLRAQAQCRSTASLEYDREGRRIQWLGDEWKSVPLAGRWWARSTSRP